MASYLCTSYFQKSYTFLYPLLGFKRDETFKPSNTYMWWSGKGSIDSFSLIVHFKKVDNALWDRFEERTIVPNRFLESCYTVGDGKVYLFNLMEFAGIVDLFRAGKYSQFPDVVKKKVLSFHGVNVKEKTEVDQPIHTAFYPKDYFKLVAAEYRLPLKALIDGGELCSSFDKLHETLETEIIESCGIDLELSDKSLNL